MCVFATCYSWASAQTSLLPFELQELLSPRQSIPILLCTAQGFSISLYHGALKSTVWSVYALINCSGGVMKQRMGFWELYKSIFMRDNVTVKLRLLEEPVFYPCLYVVYWTVGYVASCNAKDLIVLYIWNNLELISSLTECNLFLSSHSAPVWHYSMFYPSSFLPLIPVD